MNGLNPWMLINMLSSGANPKQIAMNLLKENSANNDAFANLFSLAQQGNEKEIEKFARNYFKSIGRDFDKEFKDFRKKSGL